MTITFSMAPDAGFERDEAGCGQVSSRDAATLEPMLAGARARGMADAFDMMGLAFVMIDAQGMILHVSGKAKAFMGRHLAVASEHLVGAGQDETRAIQSLIGSVLCDSVDAYFSTTSVMFHAFHAPQPMPSEALTHTCSVPGALPAT